MPHIIHPPGEVVISMRPVSVSANGPAGEIERLEASLRGRWRQATRAVMILLSAHGLPPAQIAELLDCHPATVRRWIGRFNAECAAGPPGPAAVRAVVQGMGGVGKTQLAVEYAHRFASAYDLVWWVAAEQGRLIADQFAVLAAELGCAGPEAAAEVVRGAARRWLRCGRAAGGCWSSITLSVPRMCWGGCRGVAGMC